MSGDERWLGDGNGDDHGPSDSSGPHGDHGPDPVEEFFAAHRAQVRDEPFDDLTWQRIRDGRRRSRSTRRGAWAAGLVAAAAALAVVVGPSLLPGVEDPDLAGPQPSVTDPSTGEPPTDTLPTGEPTSGPSEPTPGPDEPTSGPEEPTGPDDPTGTDVPGDGRVTAPVPEGEIPDSARFADFSTADPEPATDTGVRFALVMEECPENGFCATLARSDDGGITWAPHADLRELGLVHELTFTDQGRGWVWGDKAPAWSTTDGGRTWTVVRVGDATVQDLSVRGDELLATTLTYGTGSCPTAGDCPISDGAVVLTDPTDTDWRDDVVHDLGPVVSAELLDTHSTRYVITTSSAGGPVTSLLRLQEGRLEPTAGLNDCGAGPVAITASTGDPAHLWALCDDEFGLALHESDNGGRAWLPTNLTVPTFVLGESPPLLVSIAADHLLLVGEGNHAVTADGGQTWSSEAFLPGADARPERLEVTMFGEVIAFPTADQASAALAFWRSADGGATWESVPVRP
ncbi:hypothetical protein [Ornithinimicrobium sp. F0845]|uniref:WD40/YVTN/BNR-like repeat-containing protein n=1 Tax=Ornithinimicrobium sp. F0845 TaxID=2926412 RepID=UPI00248A9209|nr:hypothetical protein [Ornithinimicrobium sp. F0845]